MKKREKMINNYIYEYYQKINDGSILVGKWIRLLYKYVVEAVEKKEIILDLKEANEAVEWIEERCFHTKGHLAPSNIALELWQKAFVSCIFGLLDAKTGKRQFREVVLVVARKNGKSKLGSSIGKYFFEKEGGYGSEVYCLAPKLEQADIIYNDIWQMVTLDPEWIALKEAIDASKDMHNRRTMDTSMLAKRRVSDLRIDGTNSIAKKIAFSYKKSDGFNPSLAICDEIASWEGDGGLKQYEVMKSGMGAREMGDSPALLLSCSTSGYANDSIYDELIKRGTAFLNGTSKESRLLPVFYMIDDVKKWNDITELHKSNPNLGVSVSVDFLLDEIAVAEGSLSKRSEFITKYCNLKQNSSTAWLEFDDVNRLGGEALRLEDFRSSYCVGGIDLSQAVDLTSACVVIEKSEKLYVFSKFWMPANRIETATAEDGVPYNAFVQQGLLTLSGENYVDYNDVYNWFKELVEEYEILPLCVGYDRYSAQYLVGQMQSYGFKMDDVFQGTNLTPVIMEADGLIKDGKINIGNNNLLKAHLLNAALKCDNTTQKVKLIKVGKRTRIDGTAALLDALCVRQKWYGEIGEQLRNEG